MILLLQLAGLAGSISVNYLASLTGFNCRKSQDRDLLFPLTSICFTFYPLIISLPQAHYKLINYAASQQKQAFDQDQLFPMAFMICLLSITVSIIVDKMIIGKKQEQNQREENQKLAIDLSGSSTSLKFLLSLSIVFQNIVNFYFICVEDNAVQMVKEMFLFVVFSMMINYSHGYLLGLTKMQRSQLKKFAIFMSLGLVAGFALSLVLQPSAIILSLLCAGAGLQVYCSIFIMFPHIFTNGMKPSSDKARYCSIMMGLLLTTLYYPVCYLLRI